MPNALSLLEIVRGRLFVRGELSLLSVSRSPAAAMQKERPALVWKETFIGTMWKFLKNPPTQLSAQKAQK